MLVMTCFSLHFLVYVRCFILTNSCNTGRINKPMANIDLEARYEEYAKLTGSMEDRLVQMGYALTHPLPEAEVDSLEAFQSLVLQLEFSKQCGGKMSPEDMAAALKLFYKMYLKRKDLLHLLKMGGASLSEEEVQDAMRLMPIDAESGILVDDLIEFMYK